MTYIYIYTALYAIPVPQWSLPQWSPGSQAIGARQCCWDSLFSADGMWFDGCNPLLMVI